MISLNHIKTEYNWVCTFQIYKDMTTLKNEKELFYSPIYRIDQIKTGLISYILRDFENSIF